jgi:predicted RNA polymerase sigma factor
VHVDIEVVGGWSTGEIARVYLTTEATVDQRIVRATRTLTEAGAALEEPRGLNAPSG